MTDRANGELAPGARVGAYEVTQRIGGGGQADVYLARHARLGHEVVVKVALGGPHEEHARRMALETDVLRAATSIHVPRLHAAGRLPDRRPYVVMARAPGPTLERWIRSNPAPPAWLVVEVGVQLATALAEVHRRGFVHRDVKPENLVLHEDGGGRAILTLLDFGICAPMVRTDPLRLTQPGHTVGTPGNMSPEQVLGHPTRASSDVFAAGTVLYHLATGVSVFDAVAGGDPCAVARAVVAFTPPSLRTPRPDLPAELAGVIERAMSKASTDRFQSAPELRAALLDPRVDVPAQAWATRRWSRLRADGPPSLGTPAPPRPRREPRPGVSAAWPGVAT